MIRSFILNRRLLLDYWLAELKRKFAGTLLGPIWAILPPAMTIVAFWFVFDFGLKAQGNSDVPFFYYFTAGILPWFLFFDTFSSSVNTLIDNRHLITKMVFPSEILPAINFMVASVPHLVLLIGIATASFLSGHMALDNLPWFLYFYFCTALIALGCSWAISAICVFNRDAAQAATLGASLFFWVTPIMWRVDILPVNWRWIFEWNPLTYLVEGYRLVLINGPAPTFESHARFWLMAVIIWFLGSRIFMRLKHHFADVM